MFTERSIVGHGKSYGAKDLFLFVEKLIKQSVLEEQKCNNSNYHWLSSRHSNDDQIGTYLQDLRPMINKMSSEDCAAIAVKLDDLTDERIYSTSNLVTLVKNLLSEQENMRAIEKNIKDAIEMKHRKRMNKVHPELVGREPTVSFIVD